MEVSNGCDDSEFISLLQKESWTCHIGEVIGCKYPNLLEKGVR